MIIAAVEEDTKRSAITVQPQSHIASTFDLLVVADLRRQFIKHLLLMLVELHPSKVIVSLLLIMICPRP